jgi:hypothetical protein
VNKHVRRLQNEPGVKDKLHNYIKDRCPDTRCKFDFRALDSPQENGNIERKFDAIYGRVREILNGADLTTVLRNVMWVFCSLHTTILENIWIRPYTHLSPYEIYHEESPN